MICYKVYNSSQKIYNSVGYYFAFDSTALDLRHKTATMKTILFLLTLFLFTTLLSAQNQISGKVLDQKGKPVAGANIYLDGTYDGTSSNDQGDFSFPTTATGTQTLVVSFLVFETTKMLIDVADFKGKTIKMRESVTSLDAVVVTAGTMESGDKARVSVLKPLDIVTTAGSAGNIIAALQTLPGTNNVGEDGRLFVRGGEADETQTFVDGLRVAQPYDASTNNLPTRGRFSPFLFSGISFSTGGYSAEYGEALSSVLLLNTQDEPDQNKTEIALMTVGLGIGNTQKWKKSSLSVNSTYIDLSPYQFAIPQNVDWNKPFQSLAGESVYRYNFNNGIFKLYAAFDASRFDLNQESINTTHKTRVNLNNRNLYINSSYKGNFGGNWQITSGFSFGYGHNKIDLDLNQLRNTENAAHLKLKLRKSFSDRFKLSFGADYFTTQFDENYNEYNAGAYHANIAALYTEADIFFSKKLAAKVGARLSNNDLLNETSISPRISLAYKVAKFSQFSLAYGQFSQSPNAGYIKYSKRHSFENEDATHYILNFQYSKNKKTFRAETYFKDYRNLIQYNTATAQFDSEYSNNGTGYAKGLDVFWRDGYTVKNLEYWISYSFIDSQRNYKNFPVQATPSFIATHTLSLVTKYWISDWKSQVGFTHSFSTGRPYNDPNKTELDANEFLAQKTKAFNNLSFNWAYLLTQQKILYFSISNVLGTQNIFGYEYANEKTNGAYNRRAITPTADRFFFVGFFWTISDNKKDNQLNNL